VLILKKVTAMICCALGSAMIGYFANKLNGGMGAALFALGVVMLVSSIILISKSEKEE